MPVIKVFAGLEAIRASAEVVSELPSRATLEEWLAKHDSVDKETEIFDTAELEKLRQLTKGKFQCYCEALTALTALKKRPHIGTFLHRIPTL